MAIRLSKAVTMGVVGERTSLSGPFAEYWIQPRKFTVAENDQIKQAQSAMRKTVDVKALATAYAKVEDLKHGKGVSETEAFGALDPDEIASVIDMQNVPLEQSTRLVVRFGIAKSNLAVDEATGEPVEGCPKELEDAIMANADLADQISSIVQGFNRPLAERNATTSPTSPNGPTAQPGSTGTTYSLTEGSQQS